ncbi:MAG: tRNA (adenosine(37)-N6)-threonylcarbamoyltransferase complex dimerization subunit type 1 TsaB [Chloroflexi bacterium]|nr:tRNA (adenosine(37)-N6)-threonylcarbamoyltransferase complex dimerization subunit type 1 TsaB [Chloroflexota bacterium]
MLLAFDTSTSYTSVAVYGRDVVLAEESWPAEGDQTRQLLPEIDHLLGRLGVGPRQLTGIGVGLGPGSFNALRVGISAAKGLAFALNVPLLGIPSLDAVALQYLGLSMPLAAILPVGRGRIAGAIYYPSGSVWLKPEEYRNMSIEELCAEAAETTFFAGEMDDEMVERIRLLLGPLAILAPRSAWLRRAGYLAQLGWERLQRGEKDDLESLQPLYLQAPAIGKRRQAQG